MRLIEKVDVKTKDFFWVGIERKGMNMPVKNFKRKDFLKSIYIHLYFIYISIYCSRFLFSYVYILNIQINKIQNVLGIKLIILFSIFSQNP